MVASPLSDDWWTFVIRAYLLPVRLATEALRDLADWAATATIRTRQRVTYLANTGALGAQDSRASIARHECGFVDAVGHEASDFLQPLRCQYSFLWQGASLCVGHISAYGPETAVPPASTAILHGVLGATNAEEVPRVPETVVVWMLVI